MALAGVSFFKKKDAAGKNTQTELESIQSLKQGSEQENTDIEAEKKPKHGEPGVCCGSCS
ncbi:CCGSCS motif protein [Shewanella psychropiezotolerans]|uniref:CCGSCS motif protein n=1 Tax=Shewanella psychropiezotolerans TaxID=2593655 RepID=A0ABX5X1F2_9GAMM|nr:MULTISPECIES: CCGSCS motif protein [Shewanella]MPY21184.1 CCGSCS motif protein [Shewanella sp. YLB-07]MPY21971.1 CCGSCS motif protein [Shewanella sp. YLB-07]QDO85154.1 CCGSCS motif protein [Shewanella psychropiezotolerans]